MKMAIVKPIPPAAPTTNMPPHVTPGGSMARPSRVAIQLTPTMPRGLPITNPSITPRNTPIDIVPPSSTPPMLTPAFARAKSGMMPKATYGCSLVSMRFAGDNASLCARASRPNGSSNSSSSCSGRRKST